MAGQRAITSSILRPDGTPWAGGVVRFTPIDDVYLTSPAATYPSETIVAPIDSNGDILVTLASGTGATYEVKLPSQETFYIVVPDGSATTLEALRAAYVPPATLPASIESVLLDLLAGNGTDAIIGVGEATTTSETSLELDGAAESVNEVRFLNAGVEKWSFGRDTASAGNAFYLWNYIAGGYVLRIDGATGLIHVYHGLTSRHATAGIGYETGAGGTVTQATSKGTGVTINKVTGAITTANVALAATTTVTFVVTNSAVAATDGVFVWIKSGGTLAAYQVWVAAVGAGSFTVALRNITAGSLTEQPVIGFMVLKGVNA